MKEHQENKLILLIPLLVIAVICSVVVTIANNLSRERIETNQRAAQLQLITEVMSLTYDNDLLSDWIEIRDSGFFKSNLPIGVYRARNNGKSVGLVFMPVIARGYKGPIEIAVGISYNGELTGVRVHAHKETEGFGAKIHQNRSDWILGFDQRSLQNTLFGAWGVKSDGGEFDQISGATISPRGVIKAVKNTLDYYEIYKNELF